MNPKIEIRGVGRAVGELLCAVPDVYEAIERVESIEASLTQHMSELMEARSQERLAVLAIRADIELLAEEVKRGRRDWDSRTREITAGASDIGLQIPSLGFRVVKPFPADIPEITA